MDNLLEHTLEAEKHAEEQVAENVFAAKIFRFVFKDILDNTLLAKIILLQGVT